MQRVTNAVNLLFAYYSGAKRKHYFSNNCNFYIFNIKNYVNTKITRNKCSFDYLHWLLNYGKLYWKDGVLLAVRTSGTSHQSSASNLLTFLVAQLKFRREWKLSDRRLYEVFERRLLIWGNPIERKTFTLPTTTHFKNMRSFCAILYVGYSCHRLLCLILLHSHMNYLLITNS